MSRSDRYRVIIGCFKLQSLRGFSIKGIFLLVSSFFTDSFGGMEELYLRMGFLLPSSIGTSLWEIWHEGYLVFPLKIEKSLRFMVLDLDRLGFSLLDPYLSILSLNPDRLSLFSGHRRSCCFGMPVTLVPSIPVIWLCLILFFSLEFTPSVLVFPLVLFTTGKGLIFLIHPEARKGLPIS